MSSWRARGEARATSGRSAPHRVPRRSGAALGAAGQRGMRAPTAQRRAGGQRLGKRPPPASCSVLSSRASSTERERVAAGRRSARSTTAAGAGSSASDASRAATTARVVAQFPRRPRPRHRAGPEPPASSRSWCSSSATDSCPIRRATNASASAVARRPSSGSSSINASNGALAGCLGHGGSAWPRRPRTARSAARLRARGPRTAHRVAGPGGTRRVRAPACSPWESPAQRTQFGLRLQGHGPPTRWRLPPAVLSRATPEQGRLPDARLAAQSQRPTFHRRGLHRVARRRGRTRSLFRPARADAMRP